MDPVQQLLVSLLVAAGAISLFAILRLATRSPSSPFWLRNIVTAYVIAVALTMAFAGSLFYVGHSLVPFMSPELAIGATFAIHLGLLAVFRVLLPVEDGAHRGETVSGSAFQGARGAAA